MELTLLGVGEAKYAVGQAVSGVFRVPASQELKASDVTLALIGAIEVKWVPTENLYAMYQIVPPVVLHEQRKCLEMFQEVSDRDIVKTNGMNEISFEFRLPNEGIPSSFKSIDGYIAYHVVAIIKKPDNKQDRIDRAIQVVSPIRQTLKIPVHNTVEKDFGVISLGHGKIVLHASLVRKGWAPGESLVLHVDVANESSLEATPRATLYQTIVYLFGERHKGSQLAITEAVVGQKVDKHSNGKEVLAITIPHDIPFTTKTELISIKYHIHVTLDIPHAFDTHANLPIVVTTHEALGQ